MEVQINVIMVVMVGFTLLFPTWRLLRRENSLRSARATVLLLRRLIGHFCLLVGVQDVDSSLMLHWRFAGAGSLSLLALFAMIINCLTIGLNSRVVRIGLRNSLNFVSTRNVWQQNILLVDFALGRMSLYTCAISLFFWALFTDGSTFRNLVITIENWGFKKRRFILGRFRDVLEVFKVFLDHFFLVLQLLDWKFETVDCLGIYLLTLSHYKIGGVKCIAALFPLSLWWFSFKTCGALIKLFLRTFKKLIYEICLCLDYYVMSIVKPLSSISEAGQKFRIHQ